MLSRSQDELAKDLLTAFFVDDVDKKLKMEIAELDEILRREQTDLGQWRVHAKVTCLTLLSMFINLLRGSPSRESIIGLDPCGVESWSILIAFFVICILSIWEAIKTV